MLTNSLFSLIIVGAIAILVIVVLLIKALRQRVWIWVSIFPFKKKALKKIAYLHYDGDDNEAAKISIIGSGSKPLVSRVALNDGGDQAKVYILNIELSEDTGDPQYKEFGYVDTDGLIFRKGEKKPIGYTARPSDPTKATIKPERKWYELWLYTHLNTYIGEPLNIEEQDTNKSKNQRTLEPVIAGAVKMSGLRLNDRGYITSEAKAAAFSLFYSNNPRKDYKEYFNPDVYSWKDTALLSAIIYSVLFLLVFVFHYFFFRLPLMRVSAFTPIKSIIYTIVLIGIYYIIWAITRAIKIEFIERSNSIQSKIDLFNKTLSIGKIDSIILLFTIPIACFTIFYYRTNFFPLALVIAQGVLINKFAFGSRTPWRIRTSFHEVDDLDDDKDFDTGKVENPYSDDENAIVVDYIWNLGSETGKKIQGKIQLYFPSGYVDNLRRCNPFYAQKTDGTNKKIIQSMFMTLIGHPELIARLKYIAHYIKTKSRLSNLDLYDELQFALDFVQEPNITFRHDSLSTPINNLNRYIRYPDETLYDKEGDCDCKAFLAAMLFFVMGYEVLYLASREYQHAAVGIKVPDLLREFYNDGKVLANKCVEFGGNQYIICETTGDEFRVGEFMHPMNMNDFEEKFLLFDSQETREDSKTRFFNWQLDPTLGKDVSGNIILDFDMKELDGLRLNNPFNHYGQDGHSYEENIRIMFEYLTDYRNSNRLYKLFKLVNYIEEKSKEEGLDEYETLQFALDFVQEPNIRYIVDNDSAVISFANEYMRYPDETLFDKEGDCDCKSFLAAMIYHVMGYKVIFMISNKLQHAAIAIECNNPLFDKIPKEHRNSAIREYNGTKYVFCETTADGHKLGTNQEITIQDFEIIVELNKNK